LSRSRLQKREALAIATKLHAKLEPDGKHQLAVFEHRGRTILTIGIRHGKKGGHGHLVGRYGDLRLNESKAVALASCSMTKAQYIEHLRAIGDITD
jgi:hypothetical protein